MNNIVTIIGASGFLGSSLVSFFKNKNYSVIEIGRNTVVDSSINYGVIFYCAGVSIDFQTRIFDTIDAHVMRLRKWLENATFDKFVYISSTRTYIGQEDTSEDRELFIINKNDIYNQTKMMGELVCSSSKRSIVILRLSNVVGYDENSPYFLWSVFRQAKQNQNINIQESNVSIRDYLYLDDFLSIAHRISIQFIEGIYNVASSINMNHSRLETIITKQSPYKWAYGQKVITHPIISNEKIKKDLSFQFSNPYDFIDKLFNQYMTGKANNDK